MSARKSGYKKEKNVSTELIYKLKPKIPKKGTSIYGKFYIRKLLGFELVYHIESTVLVAPIKKDAKIWIDSHIDEIIKRLKNVSVIY